MRRIAVCGLLLAAALLASGCSRRSDAPSDTEESGFRMEVFVEEGRTVREGKEARSYQVEKGKTGRLQITVEREGGSLNIAVFSPENPEHFYYRGMDIPSSEFSVILSEAGEYKVWIEAEHFIGCYELNWSLS